MSRVIAQKLPLKLHAVNTGLQVVDTGLKQLAMAGKVIAMGQEDGHRRGGQALRTLCPEDKKRDGGTGVATRLVLVSMETQHTVQMSVRVRGFSPQLLVLQAALNTMEPRCTKGIA